MKELIEADEKLRNIMMAHLDGIYMLSARSNCDELATQIIQLALRTPQSAFIGASPGVYKMLETFFEDAFNELDAQAQEVDEEDIDLVETFKEIILGHSSVVRSDDGRYYIPHSMNTDSIEDAAEDIAKALRARYTITKRKEG